MNLFCFSLEGSTDSLYEPALNKHPVIQEHSSRVPSRHNSRHSSPSLRDRAKWRGSDPCIPTELSEAHKSHLKKKKRRSHVPTTSTSDNETLDNTDTNVYWQSRREKQDFVHIKNNHNEEMGRGPCNRSVLAVEDRVEQLNSERREKYPTTQGVNFEAWNPNYEPPDSHQQNMTGDAEADLAESKGKLKRFQRLVKVKKGSQIGLDDGKTDSNCHLADSVFSNDSPVITCIGLGKKTDKKSSKAVPSSPLKQQTKETNGKAVEGPWSTGVHDYHWGLTEVPPPWDVPYHTCHRPPGEPRNYGFDFTLPRATAWDRFESLVQELDSKQTPPVFSHQRVIRSITDLDISESTRSTSFGRFDSFRHQPAPVKPEENGSALSAEGQQVDSGDQTRSGSIGKKMKAISLTMRKRMGRQYAKALSEDMGDEMERDEEGEGDVVYGVHSFPKGHRKSSHSLESLYSLNSGQSSSSGVTSGSDGSSNRDSLRLDEELPLSYTGQFCGRARVHTDFVPSPYDTESLKLKVGDVIEIISKPPMGIWTGMLNNKVGNFKFIYVDLIVEKVPEPPQKMTHRRSRRPRPKTLQELLERLNLEEYASSLLLNGYQTVDDLKELKEQHLVELNVTDSEHRHRLMTAVECLQDPQSDGQEGEVNQEAKYPTESIKADLNCPRDSGCYMPSDCSDNSKEETDINVPALNHHPPMAQT